MKFQMGAEVLTQLTKQTSSANDDLGGLVKDLFKAAEHIYGKQRQWPGRLRQVQRPDQPDRG